jgi:hypothetical protein
LQHFVRFLKFYSSVIFISSFFLNVFLFSVFGFCFYLLLSLLTILHTLIHKRESFVCTRGSVIVTWSDLPITRYCATLWLILPALLLSLIQISYTPPQPPAKHTFCNHHINVSTKDEPWWSFSVCACEREEKINTSIKTCILKSFVYSIASGIICNQSHVHWFAFVL